MLPDELSGMREAINQLLPDTCDILSVTRSADGEGGWTETWGTASTVSCRLDMVQGREALAGGAVQPFTAYMLSLPYDAVISAANRVQHSSVTYNVVSVNTGQSWKAVTRVSLERV